MRTLQKHRYNDTIKLLMTASHWWTPHGAYNRLDNAWLRSFGFDITDDSPMWFGELQFASITDQLSFKSQILSKQCAWCMCDENGGKGCECHLIRYYKHNQEDLLGTYAHRQCPPATATYELNVDPNVSMFYRPPGDLDWYDAFAQTAPLNDSDYDNRIEAVISRCRDVEAHNAAAHDKSQREIAARSLPLGWRITTTPEGVELYTYDNTETTYLEPIYNRRCCYGICLPPGWRTQYAQNGSKWYIDDNTGAACTEPIYNGPGKVDFLSKQSDMQRTLLTTDQTNAKKPLIPTTGIRGFFALSSGAHIL